MTEGYPVAFGGIGVWAAHHDIGIAQARQRFAQFAVLRAISTVGPLRRDLVFKGGNALDFVWQPNRSTLDLDFSFDSTRDAVITVESLRSDIQPGLRLTSGALGVLLALNGVRQQPPGDGKTFVTFQIRVGYALPDEARLLTRMRSGETSVNVIPVEISLNEPLCANVEVALDGSHRLRVSTVEDIVAEKLRALLQQPIRNRRRRQDLLDIAVLLQEGHLLDHERVAAFLLAKSNARGVGVSRSAFHHPEIASRAESDYAALKDTTRRRFVPFDDAMAIVLRFVDELPIPDE